VIEFTVWGIHAKIWGGQIFGVVLLGGFIILLWRAQLNAKNPIDLAGMLVWPGTGQTSLANLTTLGAFLVGSWIIADLAMRGKLTEGYLGLYLGTFALGKALTEAANAWRDRAQPQPAPIVTGAAIVNQPAAEPAIRRARKTPKPKGKRR
jgi:hypothetical protein